MKSLVVDEDLHALLKILAAEQKTSIKNLFCESVILLLKKYEKDVPANLKVYYER
jgi:hypothetical protein